ncbi:hypothetical protein HLI01_22330 [Rhizobium laguerreae]|uniref:hypothetical protein n=1 Tax=Rhizobium laguerreae TaxID=1076926 RepID=UPI00147823A6|nr:hypothetical protein [Rhizobium laguerreae]NNH59475.1 hypothetical protein [Rhizobium laguerreae]
MHKSVTHIAEDDEAVSLAGVSASSPARRSGQPVILSFQARNAAASMALEDASNPVEGFESIGLLAVRLVSEWSLPRIRLLAPSGRTDDASAR